jgi:hypothetical protein
LFLNSCQCDEYEMILFFDKSVFYF